MLLSNIKNYPIVLRLGLFVLALLFIWSPFLLSTYYFLGAKDPNLTTIITMAILFVIFLFLVKFWGQFVYDKSNIFKSYGLVFSRTNFLFLIKGLIIGFISNWLLFGVEFLLGWVSFQSPSLPLIKLLTEGFISALGIGLAEELFFRGFLLWELERDFSLTFSASLNAFIFAFLHFIKPLPEVIRTSVTFPALVILGYILVLGKRSHLNLLGISIGIHSGLVWGYYIVNVGQMINYNDVVPSWITGIDKNPIAGVMGISFLLILLYSLKIDDKLRNKVKKDVNIN
ncbi:type II CAAX endopeptidase family protein [Cyanobacterium sp. Dongsha4]|uniref:CPBP family intramembrane glutamic endopeptidase n=1 Tax=Cyanobacterium sp. DS4 TaxID=2878255 RepID=UPI002E808CDC|nr:type II CAAX endopeptidase family protein [Cyanobacterium sp. Dongsha4]WVK99417.1 CPBP family intramembrane metalloprotease [Cyanobacterium sp. Dongsha4]